MVLGSTSWTVASESNVELSTALGFTTSGAETAGCTLQDMRRGSVLVTYQEMQRYVGLNLDFLLAHEQRFLGRIGLPDTFQVTGDIRPLHQRNGPNGPNC